MRNNQHRITAVILLAVFVLTFFIAAGQRFLKPLAPTMPAGGNRVIRLTRDSGRESKGIFRRKDSKNKNGQAELSAQATDGENDNKLSGESGINREKLRKESREKIRKNSGGSPEIIYRSISEKPRKNHGEGGGSYNNRGGKCPAFDTVEGE